MATTRTALVTGGASGLGAAAAKRLRAEGLQVTTLDLINADVTADVADEQALRRVAGQIGPVDVLVNSAGIVGLWRGVDRFQKALLPVGTAGFEPATP